MRIGERSDERTQRFAVADGAECAGGVGAREKVRIAEQKLQSRSSGRIRAPCECVGGFLTNHTRRRAERIRGDRHRFIRAKAEKIADRASANAFALILTCESRVRAERKF